jgi:hypothetical protein
MTAVFPRGRASQCHHRGVHGIALSVRAGASGTVYRRWAVTATAVFGVGAFVVSFRAQGDLVIHIGKPPIWAWLFPAIIDTAIGVSTMMSTLRGRAVLAMHRTVARKAASDLPKAARMPLRIVCS